MKERFAALCKKLGIKERFLHLFSCYEEKDRFYHNLTHISNCLIEFDSVRHLLENPDLVELAIWYHDIDKSEDKSATLLIDDIKDSSGYGFELPETILTSLIMATKHTVPCTTNDERYIVDIDLSILGKPISEFDEYEQNIRKEYAWVAKKEFRDGRSKILKAFLNRERIYATDFFYEKYEKTARENLERSIKKLYN